MVTNNNLIVKKLRIKVDKIDFNLVFHTRITLIQGNSGTGKTYLYNALVNKYLLESDSDIICMNYLDAKKGTIKNILNTVKNKLIIIDNADIALDEEDKWQITCDFDNQYVLFLRNFGCLKPVPSSFAELEVKNTKGYLYFPFIANKREIKQKKWMKTNNDAYLA